MASRREALMNQGLQNIVGGLKSYEDTKKAETESKRRQALEGLAYTESLAKEGFQVTPEAQAQISDAFSTGQFGAIPQLRSTMPVTEQEKQKREFAKQEKELGFRKTKSEIKKSEAEIKELERKAQGLLEPEEVGKLEDALRKEDQVLKRNLDDVASAYSTLSSTIVPGKKLNSPQELSTVINFLRTVNPGVAIKERDGQSIQNAAGIDIRLANAVRNILAGQSLDQRQVQDMMQASRDAVNGASADYERNTSALRSRVQSSGVNPKNVFTYPSTGEGSVGQQIISGGQRQQQQQVDLQKVEQAKQYISPEQAAQWLAERKGAGMKR